jgi:hypothetical protein
MSKTAWDERPRLEPDFSKMQYQDYDGRWLFHECFNPQEVKKWLAKYENELKLIQAKE